MNNPQTNDFGAWRFPARQAVFVMVTLLSMFLSVIPSYGQISSGGVPLSMRPAFQKELQNKRLRSVKVGRVDSRREIRKDYEGPGSRFTAPAKVDLDLFRSGKWTELPDGSMVWRLHIESRGALALAVLYDDFYLPPGAELYMYNADRSQVLGAYTSRNNKPSRKFMTGLIRGEEAILEYYEPATVVGEGRLHIFRIDRAYRDDLRDAVDRRTRVKSGSISGFGNSLPCHENVACSNGDDWQDQSRSVCRILVVVEEGMGFCSGTLVNNTRQDGEPYVLSAFHCQDGYTPMYDFWRFDFNYQGPDCENPPEEPLLQSVLGSELMSGRLENDFLLLRLSTGIPSSFNAYFSGWYRGELNPASGACLHHPLGDIKKVALIGNVKVQNSSIEWDNDVVTPAGHHFDADFTSGTFEMGSSGSALFNQDGLVVGQLHGGNASCPVTQGYYGRLALSWTGGGTPETRLQDWLDPTGSGVEALAGMENPEPEVGMIAGRIITESGEGISGVTVSLTGVVTATFVTNEAGEFLFDELPFDESYSISVIGGGSEINGVSTLDLIRIRKHILEIEKFDSPYKILAADVNLSKSVTTLDLIRIQKVILGVEQAFQEAASWQFVPAGFSFADPDDPFQVPIPRFFNINSFRADVTDFDIIGFKTGDVNGSANPRL